jgi:uncharacterized protein YprB with RNaseH-like and TPR domain
VELSPGHHTSIHGKRVDKIRFWQNTHEKLLKNKRRRLELKKKKSLSSALNEVKEGTTYHENTELESINDEDMCSIPSPPQLSGEENFVYFDLETTGLGRKSDIVQVSAVSGGMKFNRFAIPRQEISLSASQVTGIRFSRMDNQMYSRGQKVESVPIHDCLLDFIDFLKSIKNPVLVGHNIIAFDIPVIMDKLTEFHLKTEFLSVVKLH